MRGLHVDSYTTRGVGRGTDTPPDYWTPYCTHDSQTWQIDWHEMNGFTHPRWTGRLQQQLDQTVDALRNNLPWAAA
ncbi:hypothetical protein KBZ21_41630, partial [Streptomyces sp. A73]|nr:hypothetical protein [Streptomyces sp. A73]